MRPSSAYQTEPLWPGRLIELCAALARATDAERQDLRTRAWVLLRDCLHSMLRQDARRFPALGAEDLEDLASTKALDLLLRAECREWSPANRSPGEVVSYLRSTARHGLIRLAQQRSRMESMAVVGEAGGDEAPSAPSWTADAAGPGRTLESHEFADELLACLGRLRPRSRRVWLLRAVHELGSRDIAEHPLVRASVANVDVILMRARAHLRDCLASRGLEAEPLPAGTFSLIWDRMSRAAADEGAAVEVEEA